MAARIRFVTKEECIKLLVALNAEVLSALRPDGVNYDNIIYITTDAPASSSSVMLNLLRDRENLERKGATFIDSRNADGIREVTTRIGRGALIYVDDFAGTGKQFTRSRNHVAQYVIGTFSEFFLLPCMCEEALSKIEASGVVARAGLIHYKAERPLLEECGDLPPGRRKMLVKLSKEKWGHWKTSLGFDGLATNVVLYRNAPNTTPLLFRGNLRQTPIRGILPRWDDLNR